MRPIAALNLIILGSCFAITVCLAAVSIVVLLLGDEYPQRNYELAALLQSLLLFLVMTLISAASFYANAKNHRMRHLAQVVMWLGLAATTWFYLP